jgi:ferritin
MKLSKPLHAALNDQIQVELQAHYNYLGMSAHFECTPYLGFAKWMYQQAAEEYGHAMRVFSYLRERNAVITLQGITGPKTGSCKSPLDAFEISLKQEREVTKKISSLYELALKEKDYNTLPFLDWFLKEQIEEENSVTDIIERLTLAGKDPGALLRLDDEAGRRGEEKKASKVV